MIINSYIDQSIISILLDYVQKLASADIVSVRGMLHMEEDDIADILETAGYTTYKHRF